MPLDLLQIRILKTLVQSRSPESVFAGGSVLHRHGFRLSDDQDIFHGAHADVWSIAEADVSRLKDDGLDVEFVLKHEGLVEATVFSEEHGTSKIQWVEAGSYHYFGPVPDDELGWRLHMADIVTGKVLAAGGRRQVRDYVDLTLVHQNILPLWHVLWAAPGKDASWSPLSLAEKIAKTNQFSQAEIDAEVASLLELSSVSIGLTIREAIEEARAIFERLPSHTAGHLFVNANGQIATEPDEVLDTGEYHPIAPSLGGTWASGPDMDHMLITRLVEAYGRNGSKLSGEEPSMRANRDPDSPGFP